jgi:hypothetical protein
VLGAVPLGYSRGMSSHDDWSGRTELPKNTGEFRATPDLSASTAEFKAFARAYDKEPDRPWTADSWPAQPDPGMPAAAGRRTWLVIAAVVAIALVITIVLITVG